MSFNDPEYLRKMYPDMFQDDPVKIWFSLVLLLAIFLILPYIFVKLEDAIKKFKEIKLDEEVEWRFRSC